MEEKEINLEELKGLTLDDIPMDTEECACERDYIKENLRVLSTKNVINEELNKEEFSKGVYDVSYLCGAISALVSVGINPNKAMDYIVDKEATSIGMKHNIDMANIQKDISVETAKFSYANKADNF